MAQESTEKLFASPTIELTRLTLMGNVIIEKFSKMADNIQCWAVSAALHVAMHGDTTEVSRVIKALSDKGFRSNALKIWFTSDKTGAPFKWMPKDSEAQLPARLAYDSDKAKALKARYEADKDAVIAMLMGVRFDKLSKESEFEGFNLPVELRKLEAKATKTSEDPAKKDHKANNFKGLPDLRAIVHGGKAIAAAEGASVN